MRLIGLMMICNEQDMLSEALKNHAHFCDAVLVLDGTAGKAQLQSEAICRSFPQVKGYWEDHETGYEAPLRDGARQFLLERARARFGVENWYAILHGDEIWGQDPRQLLQTVPPDIQGIAVHLYHFFPHVSERGSWNFEENVSSIEALSRWYMRPPIVEHRLFRDTGDYDFTVEQHSRVIPPQLTIWQSDLVVKQYNYRSPQQAHERAVSRRNAAWQDNHYQHLIDGPDGFFVETLASKDWKWARSVPLGSGEATNVNRDPLPCLDASPAPAVSTPRRKRWWQRLLGLRQSTPQH